VADSGEHGNESLGYIICGEFLDRLKNCQLLKNVRHTPNKLVAVVTAPGVIEKVPASMFGLNSEQSNCCCIHVMIASGLRRRGRGRGGGCQ